MSAPPHLLTTEPTVNSSKLHKHKTTDAVNIFFLTRGTKTTNDTITFLN